MCKENNVKGKERKKISKKVLQHSRSKSHAITEKVMEERRQKMDFIASAFQHQHEQIKQNVDKKHQQTIRIFQSTCVTAKEDLSFKAHPKLCELHHLNGTDMGIKPFFGHASQNIIQFLAKEMNQELITYSFGFECPKFSIIVDESTTISNRTVLICYVIVVIMREIQNVLLELCELDETLASDIAKALYDSFVPILGLQTVKMQDIGIGV